MKPEPKPKPKPKPKLLVLSKPTPMQLVVMGICALVLIGVVVMMMPGAPPDPDALAASALGSGNAKAKAKAASQLAMLQGKKVVPLLRKLAKESKDGEVVVVAVSTLSDRHSMENLPIFFVAMDHPEKSAREAAYKAVLKIYDGKLPGNLKYDVEGPTENRAKVVVKLQEIYKEQSEKTAPPNPSPEP